MGRTLWIFGLAIGFLEAAVFLLFSFDTRPDILGMTIHSLPGFLVLASAILGIWFRKTAGLIIFLEGVALALLWLFGAQVHGPMSAHAYPLMPGALVLGGFCLFLSGLLVRGK